MFRGAALDISRDEDISSDAVRRIGYGAIWLLFDIVNGFLKSMP
jgi:hypothetical protein